jgi:hypothetical protein
MENTTLIQVISGVLAFVVLAILVQRRRARAK